MKILGKEISFNFSNKDTTAPEDARPRSVIKYEQQLIRSRQDIASWRSALLSAESILYPNRTRLYTLYKDVVLDAQVTALMTTRKNAILGSDFVVKNKAGEVDEKKTELIEKKWFRDFIDLSLDSIFWGHSLIQFGDLKNDEFTEVELIPRQYVKPEYSIVTDTPANITGVNYLEEPYATWSIGVGGKRDLGLLMKVAPLVLWKKNALGAWAEYSDLFGVPMRIGKTNTRDEPTRKNMENMLKNMGGSAYGVFDTDDLIEMLETRSTDAYQVFDMMVERCNSEIAKLILGQTGTTDSKSFVGAAEVHERVANMYREADEIMIENIISYQLIPLLNKHGFGLEGFTIEMEEEQELSLEAKSKIDIELLKYYKIPADYIMKKYGTPVEEMPKENTVAKVKNSLDEYYS